MPSSNGRMMFFQIMCREPMHLRQPPHFRISGAVAPFELIMIDKSSEYLNAGCEWNKKGHILQYLKLWCNNLQIAPLGLFPTLPFEIVLFSQALYMTCSNEPRGLRGIPSIVLVIAVSILVQFLYLMTPLLFFDDMIDETGHVESSSHQPMPLGSEWPARVPFIDSAKKPSDCALNILQVQPTCCWLCIVVSCCMQLCLSMASGREKVLHVLKRFAICCSCDLSGVIVHSESKMFQESD